MKIQVLHASVNPFYYDTKELAKMSYDEAVNFFNEDRINCSNIQHYEINAKKSSEYLFAPDGILGGDDSDTNLVWLKITPSM